MKYAFSTLACPAWSIERVAEEAARLGYDGVELRLLDGDVIDPVADRGRVERAVGLCRARGVEVCALDTSCRFNQADPVERERQVAEARRWIALAHHLRTPLLRVFGGPDQDDGGRAPTGDEANDWVARSLRQIAPDAERAGVTVVLETHDAFSSAQRVAAVLSRVDSGSVAALWDSHHPYRVGETARDVVDALDGRIAHAHVKDARRLDAGGARWELVLLGEGEVPVREQLAALKRRGYEGWVSVEWEKKWHPEIAGPEVALPQHIAWLKSVAG